MAKKFDFLSPGVEIREIDQSFIPQEREAEGPIIIGRTRKGPANKPVRIRNLDDYVSVFGLPVPGGAGSSGDLWREGNTTGPTYASYAAQAWLASEQSPITVVRIAGEQHGDATTDAGKAGWKLDGAGPSATVSTNSTAYGLFLVASSSTNQDQTGSLAAVFYANDGALALSGTAADGIQGNGNYGAALVQSTADSYGFKMSVYDASNNLVETLPFNFGRNSSHYIRNVFNTNPQLVNPDTNETTANGGQLKSYWLGESFNREVESLPSSSAGSVYGVLMPLHSGSTNWSGHKEGATESESGWVICQKEKTQKEIFKFKSLHVGDDVQRNYLIAIEEIREPSNPLVNKFGTFTVVVKSTSGQTVERFSGCNLNPNSPNYLGRKIGDQYLQWNDNDKRYRTYGEYQNQSNYIYVEIKDFIQNGAGGQGLLPAGFKGPVRPKGFTLASGSTGAKAFGDGAAFAGAFVAGSGSTAKSVDNSEFVTTLADFTGSFKFPSIPLRQNGTEGGAPNAYKAYYGIRPKISTTSNNHDSDYCDYLRRLPVGVSSFAPGSDFEHSFIFTLDDLVVVTGSATVTYTSGSNNGDGTGTAFTDDDNLNDNKGTFGELLNLGIRQFVMPLFGGTEGFDITEREPLRDGLISSTRNDVGDSIQYTLNKALDSVLDPEVVPANLLVMPGIRKPVITNRMIDLADSRKDLLTLIDLENDYMPTAERVKADTAAGSLGSVDSAVTSLRNRNLNSSYAAAFYPWVQITDNLNGGDLVWIPPSVAALGAIGRSQSRSELWFAPAGFNRGGLGSLGGPRGPRVTQARQRLDSKERDSLYDVNINPIATFPAEGVVIFGQKTLQADQSALDRINVRRLVLYLKSRVNAVARNLLFDQNVQSTWNRFKNQVEPLLSDTQARFGLSGYKLILDETTTTADLIDRNIMYAKIYIKPARAIEYIVVDFVITNTGADFV